MDSDLLIAGETEDTAGSWSIAVVVASAVARRGEQSARAYALGTSDRVARTADRGRAVGKYQTLRRTGSQLPVLRWDERWA